MKQLSAFRRGGVSAAQGCSWLLLLAAILTPPEALAAVINWTNLNGGFWSARTNWSPNTVPAATDDVFIAAPGTYTVTQDLHVTIASLSLGAASGTQTLTNPGLNLTLNGASIVSATAVFALGAGTLAGAGVLTVDGIVLWDGGTIGGALTVTTNGVLKMGGLGTKYLNSIGTLINYGLVAWSGTNDLQTANSARIINQPGALFEIQNNQSFTIYNGGAITNLGTLRKSAGGGATLITVPLHNLGTLDIQSGSVAYGPGSRFDDGTAFTGAGTNLVYTGTITFNGSIFSENLEIGGSTIAGNSLFSGLVKWTAGELSSGVLGIATNGVLIISGSGTKHLNSTGTLINYGLVAWSGTNDLETANFARIINQPGALFEIQNNQLFTVSNGGAITNLGTLRKSAGGGATLITVPLYNLGTLDVQSGSVAYGPGSRFDGGTAFTGAGTNLVYAGTITFNGSIFSENLEIGGATIAGNSLFSGLVKWIDGDLPGGVLGIATNGVLIISGSGTKNLYGTGTLINHGSVAWSGTNDLQTGNSARIINQPGALFEIHNDQSFTIYNGGVITNFGTLRKSAGGGNTLITVPLYNSGTVAVQSGTITLGNLTHTGGELSFGLNSLTNFGRLALGKNIAFTGTLGVNLNGGYLPVAGDAFTLITYPSPRAGAFTSFDLPVTHAWQTNDSIYGPTALTLSVLNTRPTLNPISQQTGDEETTITVTATATDPDPGQTWNFGLVNPPPGAVINTNTGVLIWTPTEAQGPATNTITIAVTDNGIPPLSITKDFTVIVREVNTRPSLTVPPAQTLDELTTLSVTNRAADADLPPNTLRFTLVSAPLGAILDTNTGVLAWTPTEAQGPGTNTITIAATDNGVPPLSVTNDFTVVVLESNVPPVLAAIPGLTAIQDVPLRHTNSATDADLPSNSLRFDLVSSPPGMTLDATSGVLSWTPAAGQVPSTNSVALRVTDNGQPARTDMQTFSVVAYPLPFLIITRAGTNAVLSWPAYATGFTLQQAADLKPPVFWADMTNAVSLENGMNRVTNRADASWRCFRLHYGAGTSRPWLAIARSNASVIVSWPVLATGWSLYATTNLAAGPAGWALVPPPYQSNGASLQFTDPSPWAARFYRLRK